MSPRLIIWVPLVAAVIAAVATLGAAGIGLLKKDSAGTTTPVRETASIQSISAALDPSGQQLVTVEGRIDGFDPTNASGRYFLLATAVDAAGGQTQSLMSPIAIEPDGRFRGTITFRNQDGQRVRLVATTHSVNGGTTVQHVPGTGGASAEVPVPAGSYFSGFENRAVNPGPASVPVSGRTTTRSPTTGSSGTRSRSTTASPSTARPESPPATTTETTTATTSATSASSSP